MLLRINFLEALEGAKVIADGLNLNKDDRIKMYISICEQYKLPSDFVESIRVDLRKGNTNE